jgi:bacteriocin-like protein
MAKTEKSKKSRISPDALIKPTKKGDIELTEAELDKISGGPTSVGLKIDLKI